MLSLLAIAGLVTVLIREPVRQAIALGVFGLLEALMFFTVQAPDVELSQITVSAIALPAMLFLAIAKIRTQQGARERAQDEPEDGNEAAADDRRRPRAAAAGRGFAWASTGCTASAPRTRAMAVTPLTTRCPSAK